MSENDEGMVGQYYRETSNYNFMTRVIGIAYDDVGDCIVIHQRQGKKGGQLCCTSLSTFLGMRRVVSGVILNYILISEEEANHAKQ